MFEVYRTPLNIKNSEDVVKSGCCWIFLQWGELFEILKISLLRIVKRVKSGCFEKTLQCRAPSFFKIMERYISLLSKKFFFFAKIQRDWYLFQYPTPHPL